ncbi:centrosomal protein of 126 kDa isoform X4 [Alexandromys fortis]|uniref:centrosomal protein of 126 kDa isoform X4 n=1 Tax=Alexandromys fortis TaxID=100897 RepID=UPI0021526E26|nr:centrosomal protein of 126 kDa isoform X4 [Microtus fortis]
MLAGRPGAQSAGAGLGAGPSDSLGARDGSGRPRPGAYLDMKTHLEKNLEEERQILLQQQKICRNRARKYFVESNRRRKAFEEKRKEQEEREYQIRERILQQRKQKFEEVTEKFQRAHVPLSQRKKAVFHNPVPPLDEALKQIQESNLKSEVNIPLYQRPATNWRAIDSALPSALSKNDYKHQKYLVRRINHDKEMTENNIASLATNKNVFQLKLEETQKLLENQHLSSLQKFCDEVNQITNSETLSSIDSLEAAEREEIYLTLSMAPSTSSQQSSVPLKSANLQSAHLNCFDEDNLSFSKTQHINNWLTNLDAQNTQPVASFSDMFSKSSILPSWECLANKEQNPPTLSRAVERSTGTANDSVLLVCSPSVVALDKKGGNPSESHTVRTSDPADGALQRERPSGAESPTFKVSRAWTTPESLTQEAASFSIQERLSELTQENRTASLPTSFVPALSPNSQSGGPLSENNKCVKEIDPVQCSDKLYEMKDVKCEKINYFNCNKEKLSLFSENFQATYAPQNSHSKDRKQKASGPSATLCNITPDCDVPDQHGVKPSVHEQDGVRLPKSILKKESRYEHDYLKTLVINQGFKFRHQKAEAIRDSIELIRQKGKGTGTPKTIKKLRWLDESGNTENCADDGHPVRNRAGTAPQWLQYCQPSSGTRSLTSAPDCPAHSAGGKKAPDDGVSENVADLGGCDMDSVPLNSSIPSGYSFAKQAWSACRREENKAPVHAGPIPAGDAKTPKSKAPRGAKVTRRMGSAKVQTGLVHVNRKATVSQPPSSSKANTLAQTQGKLIIPHPPPKPPTHIKSSKTVQVSPCHLATPEHSQSTMTQNCLSSCVLPTECRLNQWTQESRLPFSDACSDLLAVTPALPSPYSPECQTAAKGNHSNGSRTGFQQDGTVYCTQKSPVCEEIYQSLVPRSTEEESIFSWGRRNHGCQNERATDSAVTRRKQVVENKWRKLLEQKRKVSGSVGMKGTEQMIHFGQTVQSTSEPIQATRGPKTEEVSGSTSECSVPENLMNSSMPEDDILTAMNSKQLQKPSLSSSKPQPSNICTVSAEEEKVLQSLRHLNERLYYVQEAIFKNPSIKTTFQLIPLLNNQPRARQSPDVGSRVQRKY